jgi:hypothetical protein
MTIRTSTLILALAVVSACEPPEGPNTAGGKSPAPAAPPSASAAAAAKPSATGSRTISDSQRASMKAILAGEMTGKKAWILSQPGNEEVTGLVSNLTGIFKDAGWEVSTETASGISLKPGVMTLIAEEQYPPYVDAVVKALDASGLDAKSASGYRGYYEAKKKETPNWPGIGMRADQDFIIVVGPKPAA